MYRRLLVFLVATLSVVTGCASGGQEAEPPATGMLAFAALPTPSGEIVLTIKGAGNPNLGDEVRVDLAGIESLGTQTATIHEPFLDADLEVTGVDVESLLAAAGVDPDASLVWTALDDYQVYFSRRQAGAENALLATRVDDRPITIADGGPIRVVFTDPDGILGRDTNQWIWSLHQIEVQ